MFNRDRIRGLIAQSLYEELERGDKAQLDRALDKSAALREEAEELRRMVEGIPQAPISLPQDLREGVRAGLREAPRRNSPMRLHLATGLVAFVLVISGVGYVIIMQPPVAHAPGIAEVGNAASPLAGALAEAQALADGHDYSQAYATLARSLAGREDAVGAGEVRQTMAKWAYAELRWYPEARENYDALRMRYSTVFQANPENVFRLNLLDEAQGADGAFAPLHALDAARRGGSFEQFEALLSGYPATYVASLAAEDMARLSVEEQGDDLDAGWRVTAMESALTRCTNPIAQAQLKVEVGHLVYRELHDTDRARALYEEVAESEITVLAELARSSLLRLEVSRQ